MQIGASYMIQFSLVMGCGREPSPHIDTQVRLEFSTNHGLTWHLVKEVRKPKYSLMPLVFTKRKVPKCTIVYVFGVWLSIHSSTDHRIQMSPLHNLTLLQPSFKRLSRGESHNISPAKYCKADVNPPSFISSCTNNSDLTLQYHHLILPLGLHSETSALFVRIIEAI